MRQAFGYVRVSTARQGQHGVSLPEQRDAIARYAQQADLHVVRWFEEQETASKRGRRVFREMLSALKQRKATSVIVHKVDRSARNLGEWAEIEELLNLGVDVFVAHDNIDLRSRGGRLVAGIQAVVAADYSRNLSDEARKGFYGRIKQGIYPRPAPLGYADAGGGKPKLLVPETACLVRDAFELYATGRFSLRQLTSEMASRGLRNKTGRCLRLSEVAKLLHNPFYIGLIHVKARGETFQGAHEPLVSTDLFKRVQRVLQGRSVKPVYKHDFLFRRMVRCGHCHRLLVGERQKGRVYYRCHLQGCKLVSVRESDIEASLESTLRQLALTADELAYCRQELEQMSQASRSDQQRVRQALTARQGQVTERLARLTDALLDGTVEKELFQERKTALLMERRSIEDRLRSLDSEPSPADRLSEILELASDAYLLYESGSLEEKRDLMDIVCSNREVIGKQPVFTLVPVMAEIANRSKRHSGGPSQDSVRTQKLRPVRTADVVRCDCRDLLCRLATVDGEAVAERIPARWHARAA